MHANKMFSYDPSLFIAEVCHVPGKGIGVSYKRSFPFTVSFIRGILVTQRKLVAGLGFVFLFVVVCLFSWLFCLSWLFVFSFASYLFVSLYLVYLFVWFFCFCFWLVVGVIAGFVSFPFSLSYWRVFLYLSFVYVGSVVGCRS